MRAKARLTLPTDSDLMCMIPPTLVATFTAQRALLSSSYGPLGRRAENRLARALSGNPADKTPL